MIQVNIRNLHISHNTSCFPPPHPTPNFAQTFPSIIERLRFTFTPNGKREFAPRDQVFPLFFVYCLLLLHKISSFMLVLSTRIVPDFFYLLIFYSEKFSTDVCRLPYAVNVNLNLSRRRKNFGRHTRCICGRCTNGE